MGAAQRPLVPLWVTRGADGAWDVDALAAVRAVLAHGSVHAVVCVVASATGASGTLALADMAGVPPTPYTYLAGAADDEESWSEGLTPAMFWAHLPALLQDGPAACEAAVRLVVDQGRQGRVGRADDASVRRDDVVARTVWIADTRVGVVAVPLDVVPTLTAPVPPVSTTVDQRPVVPPPPPLLAVVCHAPLSASSATVLPLGMRPDKRGRAALEAMLPSAVAAATAVLAQPGGRVIVACPDGATVAPVVATAILVAVGAGSTPVTKAAVAQQLALVLAVVPTAHPPRPLLKAVNEYLMPQGGRPSVQSS